MRLIKKPDEAKRLARTILSDILLYNQAKVKEGIEKDSLFDILTEELAEGKDQTAQTGPPPPVQVTSTESVSVQATLLTVMVKVLLPAELHA